MEKKEVEIKTEQFEFDNLIQKVHDYCKSYYEKNLSFPRVVDISKNTRLKYKNIGLILKILENKKIILKEKNKYLFPDVKIDEVKNGKKIKKGKKIVKKEKNINIKIFLLKLILTIVGSMAGILSIYYTKIWFDSTTNPIISIILSVIMVGFSIAAFEIIILLKQNGQKILSVIFSILWIIVLIFSMSSTIAGQYNTFRDNKIAYTLENSNNTYLYYEELKNQENSLISDIEDKVTERKRYVKLLQEFDTVEEMTENKKTINSYRNTIYYLENDIKKLKEDYNKIVEEKKTILSDNKTTEKIEKEDFFEWSGNIIKVKPYIIQFWLSLFPAIFIDIIAPLSFAIVLFLKPDEFSFRNKTKTKKKRKK